MKRHHFGVACGFAASWLLLSTLIAAALSAISADDAQRAMTCAGFLVVAALLTLD